MLPPPAAGQVDTSGVFDVPAGSILIMDLHVLNASASPLDVSVLMNLITIPQSQVKQEGGVYFFNNPFIRIPANGSSSARMSCPVPNDVTLVNGQTHMHKQGLRGVVNLEDGTGKMLQQLYQTNLWSSPPVTVWSSPTLELKAGQQIDYQCNYQNPNDTDVIQGLSAKTNEMCVWVGAYCPRDTAFEYCNGTGGWGEPWPGSDMDRHGDGGRAHHDDVPRQRRCGPDVAQLQRHASYQTACASQVAALKAANCN